MTKKVSIVIPVYNDFDSMTTLAGWLAECNFENVEFYFFNNGSTDERVHEFLNRTSPHYKSLSNPINLGFGGGIRFAINQLDSQWVGWMPGNLKIKPQDLKSILVDFNPVAGSLIKAKRTNRGKVPQLKTWLAGLVQTSIMGLNMFDTGGTPTICERSFVQGLENPPNDFVFESYVLYVARKRKMKVVRPPIPYGVRVFGSSHWQKGIKSELKLMLTIIKSSRSWRKSIVSGASGRD